MTQRKTVLRSSRPPRRMGLRAASSLVLGLLLLAFPVTPADAAHASPAYPGEFPDPFVLVVGGTYYAFGTQAGSVKVQVMSSHDRIHWNYLGDALPNLPSWSSFGSAWAPAVLAVHGGYVLYYTTPDRATGVPCISAATATAPAGPYTDSSAGPMICQSDLNGSIDPNPFVDASGTAYLLWKSQGVVGAVASQIWAALLFSDGKGIEGSPAALLAQNQAWETPTIEGPAMVRDGARYDLFYAANNWFGASYAIGVALCSGPMGPCSKPIDQPVFASDAQVVGPGGPSFLTDPSGAELMAYAGWTPGAVGYPAGRRALRFATVAFAAGRPVLDGVPTIDGGNGYRMAGADGSVFAFGDAGFYGSASGTKLHRPMVGMTSDPGGLGYWMVASDGGVFAFGDARFLGSTGALVLNAPVVGMASTPTGLGYWLVASDGGIFAFGDAAFFGSTGAMHLNQPIVAIASTPTGRGYWLVASDGGIFSFGDAAFFGSTGAMHLNQPVVAMARTPTGRGYWLAGSDGGIFSFGDASYFGSTGAQQLNAPIVGMAAAAVAGGYQLLAADGGVFTFGGAGFYGSAGNFRLRSPIVGGGPS